MKQINLQKLQNNLRNKFSKSGVKMVGPETIYFSKDTKIGKNVTKATIDEVYKHATDNLGQSLFVVHMNNEDGSSRRIISKKIRVSSSNHFLIMLRDLLGESNVWIS